MRVFISYSSKDRNLVEQLANQLAARGFTPWFDGWEILPGDNIVSKINDGLDACEAGIIVFSPHSRESQWVDAETGYLTYARIQEGKVLIPVMAGEQAWVAPLLRPLARRVITEIDAIDDALRNRRPLPRAARPPEQGSLGQVVICLQNHPASASVQVEVTLNGLPVAQSSFPEIPKQLAAAQQNFLIGARIGIRRSPAAAERAAMESTLAELGRELRSFCLPGDSAPFLQDLLDGCGIGKTVEICFEANTPELLALPFEALRLPNGRVLAIQPTAVLLRRPTGLSRAAAPPLAGPLKILVAVGAPDEEFSGNVVLDIERELQNILDAVEPANKQENVQVRILETGHPDSIAAALREDAYHVLHISCHGLPGALELEDEDGHPVRTTASQLIESLRATGRPLPMVLLNTCHGGVHDARAASLAEALLRAGIQCVLAMQTSVTDFYATELAREFYLNLATRRELLLPSRALADARKRLETDRLNAAQQGGSLAHIPPEYATATLFVTGEDQRLADFGADKQPLHHAPQYTAAGPVPQLRPGDLIGRRKELREVLRTLRNLEREYAGVVLTGIGGVGKSTIAGRAIQRLIESGWIVAPHVGRFDIGSVAVALGQALALSDLALAKKWGASLVDPALPDQMRFPLVQRALAEIPVLLLLDDFEQNLQVGGGAFLDPATPAYLTALATSAATGRLLLTSRYPVPGMDAYFCRVSVGPLSIPETRKLILRLEGLAGLSQQVLSTIGGHPSMLELLEAIHSKGKGRFPLVTKKLERLLSGHKGEQVEDGLSLVLLAGARDIFLEELLQMIRSEGREEFLFQMAASNLPVTAAGLARMIDENGGDADAAAGAILRLQDLSLAFLLQDGTASIHRWTAEGLRRISEVGLTRERSNRAGRYRIWRVRNESQSIVDGIEAVRNYLAGQNFDKAVNAAKACFDALQEFQQSSALASLASEVLEKLPETHPSFNVIADREAEAHLSLGMTDLALSRYRDWLVRAQRLVDAEPERADYQRDLSFSQNKMGDVYSALGDVDQAREFYQQSLAIRKRLADGEPKRADYQRDLSVSYDRIGDVYSALGEGDQAREAYRQSIAIAQRLAEGEPERADYQRDLSVSYNKVGDVYRALGELEQARESHQHSLAIIKKLAEGEPERADYQRDLSVSYNKVGDVYRALGELEQARESYQHSLAIIKKLAEGEPERADYQRDLSVSYNKVGDVYRALGEGEQARESYRQSLAIFRRLAEGEPERADYQRDLAASLWKIALVTEDKPEIFYSASRSIFQNLKNTGRLNPVDEQYLKKLNDMLDPKL